MIDRICYNIHDDYIIGYRMKCEICGNEYTLSCRRCRSRINTWGIDGTLAIIEMAKEEGPIESNRIVEFTEKYYIGKAKTRSDVANVFRTAMKVLGYKGTFVGRIHTNNLEYRAVRQRENQAAKRWGLRNSACDYCGSADELRVHHIVPLSWGGVSSEENCMTLCEKCHREIHSKLKNHLNRSLLLQYLGEHKDEIKELASLSLKQ